MLRAFEAIIGFGLLTSSVSWLLSVHPLLENRRSLAQQAALLHKAELGNGIDMVHECGDRVHDWIIGLAGQLASLRNQMGQFPISYYIWMREPQTALAWALPYLCEVAERGTASNDAAVRLPGTALGGAVEDFLGLLAEVFRRMSSNDKKAILRAYSREQMPDMNIAKQNCALPRSQTILTQVN